MAVAEMEAPVTASTEEGENDKDKKAKGKAEIWQRPQERRLQPLPSLVRVVSNEGINPLPVIVREPLQRSETNENIVEAPPINTAHVFLDIQRPVTYQRHATDIPPGQIRFFRTNPDETTGNLGIGVAMGEISGNVRSVDVSYIPQKSEDWPQGKKGKEYPLQPMLRVRQVIEKDERQTEVVRLYTVTNLEALPYQRTERPESQVASRMEQARAALRGEISTPSVEIKKSAELPTKPVDVVNPIKRYNKRDYVMGDPDVQAHAAELAQLKGTSVPFINNPDLEETSLGLLGIPNPEKPGAYNEYGAVVISNGDPQAKGIEVETLPAIEGLRSPDVIKKYGNRVGTIVRVRQTLPIGTNSEPRTTDRYYNFARGSMPTAPVSMNDMIQEARAEADRRDQEIEATRQRKAEIELEEQIAASREEERPDIPLDLSSIGLTRREQRAGQVMARTENYQNLHHPPAERPSVPPVEVKTKPPEKKKKRRPGLLKKTLLATAAVGALVSGASIYNHSHSSPEITPHSGISSPALDDDKQPYLSDLSSIGPRLGTNNVDIPPQGALAEVPLGNEGIWGEGENELARHFGEPDINALRKNLAAHNLTEDSLLGLENTMMRILEKSNSNSQNEVTPLTEEQVGRLVDLAQHRTTFTEGSHRGAREQVVLAFTKTWTGNPDKSGDSLLLKYIQTGELGKT